MTVLLGLDMTVRESPLPTVPFILRWHRVTKHSAPGAVTRTGFVRL